MEYIIVYSIIAFATGVNHHTRRILSGDEDPLMSILLGMAWPLFGPFMLGDYIAHKLAEYIRSKK